MAGNGTKTSRYEFDDTDRKILELLKANGRATNQQIARILKISAATVSARIRQMEDAKAMKVVAATDFAAFGYNIHASAGEIAKPTPGVTLAIDPSTFDSHLLLSATT